MEEKVKDATEVMILNLIKWVESGAEFVKGQAPEYLEQIYKISLIKCWMDIIIFTFIFCIFIFVSYISIRKMIVTVPSYDCPSIFVIGGFAGPMICIFVFCGLICEIQKLITIYVAPKVFILSHLREMIK